MEYHQGTISSIFKEMVKETKVEEYLRKEENEEKEEILS